MILLMSPRWSEFFHRSSTNESFRGIRNWITMDPESMAHWERMEKEVYKQLKKLI